MDFQLTDAMLLEYLQKLRKGCAAGVDGISAEHIICANDRAFLSLCDMLTICVTYGIVADSFTRGLLIPLQKKTEYRSHQSKPLPTNSNLHNIPLRYWRYITFHPVENTNSMIFNLAL